jgi:hypothetical protein
MLPAAQRDTFGEALKARVEGSGMRPCVLPGPISIVARLG